jgi:hypothetical protein
MASERKRKFLRFEGTCSNAIALPTLGETASNIGVTRAELNAVVYGLYQHMEVQNNRILDKINALQEEVRQLESDIKTIAKEAHVSEEWNTPQRATGITIATIPQMENSWPRPTIHERLSRQTFGRIVDNYPLSPDNDEEHIPEMIEQREENGGRRKQKLLKKVRCLKPPDFTPLTDTPENIFLATKDVVLYPKPTLMRRSATDNGKFCQFHNQPGHDTNQCRHLRKGIEKLLKRNELQQYVKKDGNDFSSSPKVQLVPTQQCSLNKRTVAQGDEGPIISIITESPHQVGKNWMRREDVLALQGDLQSERKFRF